MRARSTTLASYPVWELCGEHGISICVQTNASGIPATIALAKRFPKVPIIVDHFARPDVSGGPPYAARRRLMSLAALPNVYLKLTPVALGLMQSSQGRRPCVSRQGRGRIRRRAHRLGLQLAELPRHAQGACCGRKGGARLAERGRPRCDPRRDGASALSCPEESQVRAPMPAPYPSSGPVTLKTNFADSALSAALKAGKDFILYRPLRFLRTTGRQQRLQGHGARRRVRCRRARNRHFSAGENVRQAPDATARHRRRPLPAQHHVLYGSRQADGPEGS